VEKQLEYHAQIDLYQPEQLVFVNKSSVDHCTTYHGHTWSIWGIKAQWKAFFVRGWW